MLKDALTCLPDQVLHMFQKSFDQSVLPSDWAKATITPLPKPGDKSLVTNLEQKGILVDCQYGYRKKPKHRRNDV